MAIVESGRFNFTRSQFLAVEKKKKKTPASDSRDIPRLSG